MVAVIKTGHSIHRILNYNENKVKEGVAECIGEGNYPIDADQMNFTMKLNRFLKQLQMNENVTRNSVHVSLNFDPSETDFPKEKLMQIANTYMEKIGFGKQPYLVYQHHDAGHPHIHLISIKVRHDGSRIDMNNIGRNESENARKEIEEDFGLVKAEGRKINQDYQLQPITVSKVRYGKLQSKKALTTVLDSVLSTYKYASLPELNAVLRQYNVLADRGSENSRVFKAHGLVYRILDETGNPVGVPIKASDFYNRPTLNYLEGKFKTNTTKPANDVKRVKNAIDMAFMGKLLQLSDLIKALGRQGIHLALRQNEAGLIYGLTYVDHQTKCVFNGSALGKQYSAKAILERCQLTKLAVQNAGLHSAPQPIGLQPQATASAAEAKPANNAAKLTENLTEVLSDVTDALMQSEQAADYLPYPLKGGKKKKKRRNQNNNQ